MQLRSQGRLKVFIDGRAETAFSNDTYTDYLTVLDRKPGWIDVIESSGADFVLWPRWQAKDVATGLVHTGRWRSLYRDSVSQLLVRTTTALPDPLVASPESAYRQLTLGVTALLERQLEAARRHLERALQIDPDLQPACTTLVEVELLGATSRVRRPPRPAVPPGTPITTGTSISDRSSSACVPLATAPDDWAPCGRVRRSSQRGNPCRRVVAAMRIGSERLGE